jgi:hypothetical protein
VKNKLDTSPEALAEELLGRPYSELATKSSARCAGSHRAK